MQLRRVHRQSAFIAAILGTAITGVNANAAATTVGVAGVVDLLNGTSSNLTAFASFLNRFPDLVAEIQDAFECTIFAPSNAAFAQVSHAPAWQNAISSPSSSFLEDMIRYHILDEKVYEDDFLTTPRFAHSLMNESAYSDVTGGQVIELRRRGSNASIITGLKQNANVMNANLNFSTTNSSNGNGVIHIVDTFFQVPLDLPTTLAAADLTSFAGALNVAGLISTISNVSDVTIFAPTNAAFQNIANMAAAWSPAQLEQVLAYHVVPHTLGYSSILDNTNDIPTLATGANSSSCGLDITLTSDGAVFVGAGARVINADVLIANGVLHIVDAVLNPNASASALINTATTAQVLWSSATAASASNSVPFTSGQTSASSINAALEASTNFVRAGYSTLPPTTAFPTGTVGLTTSSSSAAIRSTSRSLGMASMPTAVAGNALGAAAAAALLGAAGAFLADF